jgi:drug/metabolite transporter (DMT)-like permease
LSALSYGIALWAMTKAPIGVVAALRETSVLFAILMGAIFLKEPLGPVRVIAALLIVAGIAMMRLG